MPRWGEAGEGGRAPARLFFKLARTQNNNERGSEQVARFHPEPPRNVPERSAQRRKALSVLVSPRVSCVA